MSFTRSCALCAAFLFAVPVVGPAEANSDFSARFVKPPKPGTKKRVTVQIAPRANPAVMPPPGQSAEPGAPATSGMASAPSDKAAPEGRYGWFWQSVAASADSGTGPGRLEPALSALKGGPGGARVTAPRVQNLQEIATRYGSALLRHSVGTEVSPALALAVLAIESGGKPDAVSRVGAEGLMQLMPDTAAKLGVADSFDPDENIKGGIAFLDALMRAYGGDPVLVLAGYNAGQTAVANAGGVPPFAETRDYVPKVLAAFEVARALCKTPPMMISDGCVFHVSPGS
ncbi:Soluble lytic murein transglycosylase precursor [Roseivivax sp. THAF40]|uniref:lytic transglycosylase domain-containing protein n=1 Tax=unclassified Roseivivax TaxID=2639302 RepID=UPI0012685B6C|nr:MULTISPECIES: lytic transglycosylase domain-containing protein [unclassified Roseivivax]QFS81869.1 Soluble lytic murein transglycosylase precursor [Roseivivax sp. THAF197b]QFT45669.1 Soluble lytic murein transglycosylase precursor [Roseivivax sp. THAF40]